jgi:hypothetical protein
MRFSSCAGNKEAWMSLLSNRPRYFQLAYLGSLVVYVALAGASAWSQEVTAVITGTITDPSGSAISSAVVTATDTDRGSSFSTKSNAEGTYNLPRIPIGTYTLRVEAKGFRTEVVHAFTLVLNQTARYDFKMEIGKVTEQVEVSSAAPLLQTQTTEISTIIDSATNVALPLASRNYVQLALLAPGAVTPNREAIATSQRIDNAGQPYINGNREQDNNFLLDGMDNNQVSDNLVAYTPSPDAIEEFNLITQNASAEFGNFQGGIISASIKSGTNHFHGALWEFFRNDKLNANNYFNDFFDVPKAGYRWNMFGATFGGPIIKNKLFFFGDYQGQRFPVYGDSTFSAFTQRERNGDFGQLCTDPAIAPAPGTFDSSGNCINTANTAGTQVLDPFTGANIPFNNLATYIANNTDPALTTYYNTGAGKVFSGLVNSQYYPSVSSLTGTSIFNNFIYSTKNPLNVDQGDVKIDYDYSEKDRFFGRFSKEAQVNNPVNTQLLESVNLGTATMYNGVASWTHVFHSNLLNDFRFGVNWVQLLNNATANPGIGDLGAAIGIANGNSGGEGLPALGIGPSSSVGGAGIIQDWSNTVLQIGDTLDWTHGHHTTHLGFQFIRERMDDFYAGNNGIMGYFTMSGTYSGAPDTDFYLGMVNSEGQYFSNGGSSNAEIWGQRSSVIGAFIQDDWRMTPDLTLNLGMRFQAHTPWIEEAGREVNFNPNSGQPIYPAGSTLPTVPGGWPGLQPEADGEKSLYNGYYGIGDWQPRLGVAYTPSALHGKTVIRAAITFSDYLEGTGNNLRPTLNIPYSLQLQFTNIPPFGTTGYNPTLLQLANGIPSPGTCSGSSSTCDPFNGAVLNVWAANVRPATTQQWNLAIQQQLFRDTTFQVAYVGQHGSHLMVPVNMLQGVLQSDGNVVNSPYLAGNPALLGETATGPSGCGPSPGTFCPPSAVAKGTYSIGNMSYNALQAVLQKRMGHGLEGQVSYTYSHCLTNNIGYYGDGAQASPQSAYWQNTFDPGAEWGSCYFDLAHNLTAYAIYEIPIGRDRLVGSNMNRWLNGVVGGWRVSPIFSYHGGFPLTVGGNDYSGTNSFGSRANCSGPPAYLKQIIPDVGLQWFSPTQYSNPVVGTFGTCSVSTVRGPGLNRWDASFQKEFPVYEEMRFEFRAEFLNLLNHPTFEAPSAYCSGEPTPVGGPAVPCVSGLGLISASEGERKIQFAVKFYF